MAGRGGLRLPYNCKGGFVGGSPGVTEYREDQTVRILQRCDRRRLAEVANEHGVSEQAIHTWRKKFGSLDVADDWQMMQIESENARLRKLLAARDLEVRVMKEIPR